MKRLHSLYSFVAIMLVTNAQDEVVEYDQEQNQDEYTIEQTEEQHMTSQLEIVTKSNELKSTTKITQLPTGITEESIESFAKHKRKEKFCAAKMVECLTNPTDLGPNDEIDVNNLETEKGIAALLRAMGSIQQEVSKSRDNTFRCNVQNFVGMQRCCSSSPHDFFKGAVTYACAEGQFAVPKSAIQDYVLNMGQLDDATINLTSTDTFGGNLLGNAICFVDCIFRKRFLISDDGAIIFPMVRNHIMRAVGPVWETLTLEALTNCSTLVPGIHPEPLMKKSIKSNDFCLVQPFLLVQCIRHRILLTCPSPSKRLQSADCATKLENLRQCDIFK